MAKKYLTDPVTGEKIVNMPDGSQQFEDQGPGGITDPLTGETINLPTNRNASRVLDSRDLTAEQRETLPSFDFSKSMGELEDLRAENQSAWDQWANGAAKAGVTFAGAFLDNTVGAYYGLGSLLTGGSFFNNEFGQMIDSWNDYAQENFPNYETRAEQESINPFSANFWADKVLNGAAYSAASLASMIVPGVGLSKAPAKVLRGINRLSKGSTLGHPMEAIKSGKALGELDTGLKYLTASSKSAVAESGVEARETFTELRDTLIDQELNKKREALNDPEAQLSTEELNKIYKTATEASNSNFVSNMIAVGGTNFLMFGNMVTGGNSQNFKFLRDNIMKDARNVFSVKTGKSARMKSLLNLGEDAGSEAFQEGWQYASNVAFNDFYAKKFQNEAYDDFASSALKGIGETFSTKEGLESVLIGAIVGGGMNRARKLTDKVSGKEKKVTERTQQLVDVLNTEKFQNLASKTAGVKRGLSYIQEMNEAATENNEAKYQKAAWGAFKSTVHTHLQQGTEDILLEKIQSLSEMNDQEFNDFFGSTPGLNKQEVINDLLEKTRSTIDIYKGMDYLYGMKAKAIEEIANETQRDALAVDAFYKDHLFDVLTDYDYISNREDQLGKEISEISNGIINYLDNRENNEGYLSITKEQWQDFQDKDTREQLVKELNKNKALKNQIKTAVAASKKFNSEEDFLNAMFKSKKNLSKKQAGIVSALEDIQNSNLNPAKQKEIKKKLSELHGLAVQRELAAEIYDRLENIDKPGPREEFKEVLTATLDAIDEQAKEYYRKKAANVKTPKERDNLKDEVSQEDEEIDEVVDDEIEQTVAQEFNSTQNVGIEEPLAEQLASRYYNRELLAEKEIAELNDIVNEEDFDPTDVQDFLRKINALERAKSPEMEKIRLYYKNQNRAKQETPKGPIDYTPTEFDEDKKVQVPHQGVTREKNLKTLLTHQNEFDTIGENLYDLAKINNPAFGNMGTKLFLEVPASEYNTSLKENIKEKLEIRLYAKDEDGKKVYVGKLRSEMSDPLVKEIRESIFERYEAEKLEKSGTDAPVTFDEVDLDIEVADKYLGQANTYEHDLWHTPTEIDDNPVFGVVVRNKGNTEFLYPNFKGYVSFDAEKMTVGAVYMLVKSTKQQDGEDVYVPIRLHTKKLGLFPQKNGDIFNLINGTTQENLKENLKEINETVFLDYTVDGDNVTLKLKDGNKTFEKDSEELYNALSDLVMKVDVNKINRGTYNKDISNEPREKMQGKEDTDTGKGRFSTNVNPDLPIAYTSFEIRKTPSEEDLKQEAEKQIAEIENTSEVTEGQKQAKAKASPKRKKFSKENKKNRLDITNLEDENDPITDMFGEPVSGQSNESMGFSRKEGDHFQKANEESEIEYLRRILPKTSVKVLDDLASVARQGKNSWGLFFNGAIYLRKNFGKGTAYHEAFHAVFNNYFTDAERSAMYSEAQARYGTYSPQEQDALRAEYPNLDDTQLEDIWLEEKLAEDFRRFVQYETKDKSLSERIVNWFKKLLRAINLINEQPFTIETAFENIHNGVYGKRAINNRFTYKPLARKIAGINPLQQAKLVDFIDTQFNDIVDEYREVQLKKGRKLTEEDLLRELNPFEVYASLNDDFIDLEEDGSITNPTQLKYIGIFLDNFLVENEATGKMELGILAKEHIRMLKKRYGLNIIGDTELEDIEDFEEEFIENWQSSNLTKSSKETISLQVKRQLYNLPTGKRNFLGGREMMNYDSLYNFLERQLSGIYSKSKQIAKLEELATRMPALETLVTRIKRDPLFSSKFYSHFAKAQKKYTSVVQDKYGKKEHGGKYQGMPKLRVINDSAKGINAEILTNWESALKSSDMYDLDLTPNRAKFENLKSKFKGAIAELNKKSSFTPKDMVPLSKLFREMHFEISPVELYNEYKAPEKGNKNHFMQIMQGQNGVLKTIDNFAKGKDAFTLDFQKANLATFSKLLGNHRTDYLQSSILNADFNMMYTYVKPSNLDRMLAWFNESPQEAAEWFKEDKSYMHSYLIKKLEDGEEFEEVITDSIKLEEEFQGTRYKNFQGTRYDITHLNMYLNEGKNEAYYAFPTLSDSSVNHYLKGEKMDIATAMEHLYELYKFESNRVDMNIKNYGRDYYHLPFAVQGMSKKQFLEAAETYYEGKIQEYADELSRTEVIYAERGEWKSDVLDTVGVEKLGGIQNAIRTYFYSKVLMNAEITNVFIGDLAYNKTIEGNKTVDANKRGKQSESPVDLLDVEVMQNKTATYGVLEDVVLDIKDRPYSKILKENLPKEVYDQYSEIEQTDGQTYITLDRGFDILRGAGLLTPELEKAYPKLKKGTESPSDTALILNAFKPFYHGKAKETNEKGEVRIVPVQKKDSELILLKSFADQHPKLKAIHDAMEEQGLDGMTFSSTIKMGRPSEVSTVDDLTAVKTMTFDNRDYGLQQPSPIKHIDSENKVGTQMRKLMVSDLSGTYVLNDREVSDSELAQIFFDINESNVRNSYKQLYEDLGIREGDITKLRKLLLEELDKGDYGEEYYDALEEVNGSFKLDLWNPFHSHRIEAMLNSLIKKRITQQKIKGATYINATDYGVTKKEFDKDTGKYTSEELKLEIEQTPNGPRIKYMEVILPAYSKAIMEKYVNEDGTIKDTMPDELREFVGYRIPTEDKYSMMNVRVVGFSPQSQGGHIFLPAEITRISGLDFDIDKLFFMLPEVDQNQEYIPYNYELSADEQSRAARNNGMIEIAKAVLSAPQTFQAQLNPGGFENWRTVRDKIQELRPSDLDITDFNLPQTQRQLFLNNSAAASLIGIYANHNASHAMLQYDPLKLFVNNREDFRINIGEEMLDTLDVKGIGISRRIGTLVAAAVDAVKDPIFYDLNMNTVTADMAATLVRLGTDEYTVALILNQPIFKKVVDIATRESFVDRNVVKKVIADLEKSGDFTEDTSTTQETLEKNIKNNTLTKGGLELFKKLYAVSEDLATIVQAGRADSSPAGPTMADNEAKIRRADRVKNNDLKTILNPSKIFSGRYPLMDVFYSYGIELPTETILGTQLPWLNMGFKQAKKDIEEALDGYLTPKELNKINYSIMSYIHTKLDFFKMDTDMYRELSQKLPYKLSKFRQDLPANEKYLLLDMLTIDTEKNEIRFKNTTKLSNEKLTELRNSWEALYDSSEEGKKMAEDLIKYNFAINGFLFNNKSFSNLMPVRFFTDPNIFGSEEVRKDIIGSEGDPYIFSTFVEQYIRNNYRTMRGLPTVELKDSSVEVEMSNKAYAEVFSLSNESPHFKYDPSINVYAFPKYIVIKGETNAESKLYKQLTNDPTSNKYMVIPSLGNGEFTDYTYGEDFPLPKLKEDLVTVGGIKFGSANVDALADTLGIKVEAPEVKHSDNDFFDQETEEESEDENPFNKISDKEANQKRKDCK